MSAWAAREDRRARAAIALVCLALFGAACDGGARSGSKAAASSTPGPETLLARSGPRVIHIRDKANDVVEVGRKGSGHPAIDLLDVTVKAEESGLTVVFTCRGKIPTSSSAVTNGEKDDELTWGIFFLLTSDKEDVRSYFELRAALDGSEWQGQILISTGRFPGLFKLTTVPVRTKDQIIISVPWRTPVTATKVQGVSVSLPRLPKRVFVGAQTEYSFSPANPQRGSGGGDFAPDDGKRVELTF